MSEKDFIYQMRAKIFEEADKEGSLHNLIVGDIVRFKVPEFKGYQCIGGEEVYLTPKIEPTGIYVYFTPEMPGLYEIPGISKFAVNISNTLIYPSFEIKATQTQVSIKKWFFLLVLLLLTAELIIRRR